MRRGIDHSPFLPLAVTAAVIPTIQAYSAPIVVPILVLAAMALLVGQWQWPVVFRPTGWFIPWFAALTLLGLSSAAWAVDGRFALLTAAKTFGIMVAGVVMLRAAAVLSDQARERFGMALLAGFVIGLANVQLTLFTSGSLMSWLQGALRPIIGVQRPVIMPVGLDTAMTLAGLLVWPCLAITRRRFGPLAAAALFVGGLLVVRQGESLTAFLAYLAGGLIFVGAWWLPKLASGLLSAGLACWILAAPVLLHPALTGWLSRTVHTAKVKESSLEHRRAIWGFVIDRIREHPIAGWGMGNSRVIPGGHTLFAPGAELLPLHPHDAALQLWLELGVGGALLGAVFIIALVRTIGRQVPDRTEHALALALVGAAAINGMASYNLWHEWWLAFLVLAACFLTAATSTGSVLSNRLMGTGKASRHLGHWNAKRFLAHDVGEGAEPKRGA